MNWTEWAGGQRINGLYLDAELDKIDVLPQNIIEFCKKWVENPLRESLFLSGCPGSGKSYLMVALIHELFKKNPLLWQRYSRTVDLFEESLKIMKDDGRSKEFLGKYAECDVLFFDDVGAEKGSERVEKDFFSIIDYRTNAAMPFVFTSNLTKEEFGRVYHGRIASRMQMVREIKFPQRDLRKEKGFVITQQRISQIVVLEAIQLDFEVGGISTPPPPDNKPTGGQINPQT